MDLRRQAQETLRGVVQTWAGGGPAPRIQRVCTRCGRAESRTPADRVDRVALDHPISGGPFRADLALFQDDIPVGYVLLSEDQTPPRPLIRALDAPHVVLGSAQVLDAPLSWRPLPSTARAWQCSSCLQEFQRLPPAELPTATALVARLGLELPRPPVRHAVTRCFRCEKPTLVSSWSPQPYPERAPSGMLPPGVRRVYQADAGRYHYANHCLWCGATQPDSILYGDHTGAPFGTPRR